MNRKRKTTSNNRRRLSPQEPSAQGFYTPFKDLDQHLQHNKVASAAKSSPPPQPTVRRPVQTSPSAGAQTDEGDRLFFEAMHDVTPIGHDADPKRRVPPEPRSSKPPPFLLQEELEVYDHLVELVSGEGSFELTFSDEYVEGAVLGLSPEILKKLRQGEFSYQDYVDLHGCTREEAREAVIHFVEESFALRRRCLLIVSGRGLNSIDKEPVLKGGLVKWLTRAPLARLVLAFASARPCDGGAGAFYVLLRRSEKRAPFVIPGR